MNKFFPAGFFLLTVSITLSSCNNNVDGPDVFNKQPGAAMLFANKYDEHETSYVHFVISGSKRIGVDNSATGPGVKIQRQWIVCKSQFMRVRPEGYLEEIKKMETPAGKNIPVVKSQVLAAKFDND